MPPVASARAWRRRGAAVRLDMGAMSSGLDEPGPADRLHRVAIVGCGLIGAKRAAALADRRKSVVAANAIYGATVSLLMNVLEPMGIAVRFADVCDLDALGAAVAEAQPGCILMETISNPLLRVGQIDRIAEIARQAGAALLVDNTFGTPLL